MVAGALNGSQSTKLRSLRLRDSPTWFIDMDIVAYLADFIARREQLLTLNLHANSFSSEATDELLSQMASSTTLTKTITAIDLDRSANFDGGAACEAIANIVGAATGLKPVKIGHQMGTRKIKITIECATEEAPGTVNVVEMGEKNDVIYTVQTAKVQ